jgi:2-(1,2-epoxy-1,2-dihydrophenyl)acetyl-CoA isomerase
MGFAPEQLIYEKSEGLAVITLNRPEKLNALSMQLLQEVMDALSQAEGDDQVRCVLVTGAGRGFCSGADLAENMSASGAGHFDFGAGPMEAFGRIPIAIRHLNKPSVAAINGVAAGGGTGIALACDFRIVSDQARFTTVFMRRSIMPDTGVTWLLPRLVRIDKALELLFTADAVDAQQMEKLGLATYVVPHDELMPRALEFAGRIARGPFALPLARKAVYQSLNHDLSTATEIESHFANLVGKSEDLKEGVAAFLEKREPRFVGR